MVDKMVKSDEHGYGRCTAPDTNCPHWIGTFCELDLMWKTATDKDEPPKEET